LRRAASVLDRAPVFDDTPTNPTEEATEAAVALYREGGCDGIVALGGGSPIDLAKGVALLATHPGPLETYAAVLGGRPRITAAVAPVVAIPTTSGTGSEVGRAALITLRDGPQARLPQPAPHPQARRGDPELTYGLPPRLTAGTGMDAVTTASRRSCRRSTTRPRRRSPSTA
jgi:alcohol dehydrogenase class IV